MLVFLRTCAGTGAFLTVSKDPPPKITVDQAAGTWANGDKELHKIDECDFRKETGHGPDVCLGVFEFPDITNFETLKSIICGTVYFTSKKPT